MTKISLLEFAFELETFVCLKCSFCDVDELRVQIVFQNIVILC